MARFNRLLIFFTIIILTAGSFACQSNLYERQWWLHGDGFSIGDVLKFNETGFSLRNDTIFRSEIAVAIVVNVKIRYPFAGDILEIRSIHSGEKGRYYGK